MATTEDLAELLEQADSSIQDFLCELSDSFDLDELFETGSVTVERAGKRIQLGLIVEIEGEGP